MTVNEQLCTNTGGLDLVVFDEILILIVFGPLLLLIGQL